MKIKIALSLDEANTYLNLPIGFTRKREVGRLDDRSYRQEISRRPPENDYQQVVGEFWHLHRLFHLLSPGMINIT